MRRSLSPEVAVTQKLRGGPARRTSVELRLGQPATATKFRQGAEFEAVPALQRIRIPSDIFAALRSYREGRKMFWDRKTGQIADRPA